MQGRLAIALLLTVVWVGAAARGRAQALPSATVLRTSTTGDVDHGLAEGVDRLVRARIDELRVLSVTGSSALDLADMQLAVGCVGDTDACFGAVASQAGVQVLVLPSVARAGDQLVVSITVFDARAVPPTRRAVEPVRDAGAALAMVPTLLEQLFPEAASAHPSSSAGRTGDTTTPPPTLPPQHHELSPLPIVVTAIGAVVLAVGIGFGVATNGANDAYGAAPTHTSAEVDAALAHLDEAGTDAAVADVMFVVGGLLLAGGLAWLAIDLLSAHDEPAHGASRLRLAPTFGRAAGGLSLSGDL